jgi:outer membrane protein assembly factor BamD (BamD/ComL family)
VFADITKAKELYEKILFDYPGSLYTTEARKRFRTLRGDMIN